VSEIFANVVYPALSAGGRDVWNDYARLPAQLTNRRAEIAAARLFADDPRRARFMKTVAHQQALLQIYEDFCLQDNSDCALCPFPEQMRNWP
jgi:ABC-type hemin transport system ATPase subunit